MRVLGSVMNRGASIPRSPPKLIATSTAPIGTSSATAYHQGLKRQRTTLPKSCRRPARPSALAVIATPTMSGNHDARSRTIGMGKRSGKANRTSAARPTLTSTSTKYAIKKRCCLPVTPSPAAIRSCGSTDVSPLVVNMRITSEESSLQCVGSAPVRLGAFSFRQHGRGCEGAVIRFAACVHPQPVEASIRVCGCSTPSDEHHAAMYETALIT
jgi:hypothetical protein